MKLLKPSYKARSPVVNDTHFTDGPQEPTLGSPQASFNPGKDAGPLPKGPPKYIQPAGKKPFSKGLTNKRYTNNI